MAKHKKSRLRSAATRTTAMYSAWDVEQSRIDSLVSFGEVQDRPEKLPDAFKKARYWYKFGFNGFVALIIKLRASFFNHGFCLKPLDGTRESAAVIKEWQLKNPNACPHIINAYVQETWREWLTVTNVVALWQKESSRPMLVHPEECEYTDKFNVEALKVKHGLTDKEIDALPDVPEATKSKMKRNKWLTIKKNDPVFSFDVLKLEKVGYGLSWPMMAAAFQTLAQNESMETSDALWAYISRTIFEQHSKGHENKNQRILDPKFWSWTKQWADAFEAGIKGKIGHVRITTNWDHTIGFHRPDQKGFDGLKYMSVVDRLAMWALPIAQMLMAKSVTPYLMELLQAQALPEREIMAGHLSKTINAVWDPPVPVRVSWSVRCFRDTRLAADLLKFGVSSGPTSQETFIEQTGGDVEQERERKAAEAALPKPVTMPLYDAAHGPPDKGGKPPGKNDQT